MLKTISKLIVSAMALLMLSLAAGGCGSLPEGVASTVNGVNISIDDVNQRIAETKTIYPAEVPADPESQDYLDYRGKVTKQLVAEEMERQEAEKRDLSVSDQEIEDALALYVEDKYLGNVEKMQQAFADAGMTVDDLRAEMHRDLLHQKLLDSVREETSISEEEVARFYEENKSRYVYPERRQVRQIVAADEATAKTAAARLAAGESFTAVAPQLSTDSNTASKGGLIGLVAKNQLPPAVADVAFGLGADQTSQPFKAGSGWYIIKVDMISPAANQTLDDLRDDLTFYLRNQKFADLWREYSTGLWESYDIEYADGFEPPSEETDTGATATGQS